MEASSWFLKLVRARHHLSEFVDLGSKWRESKFYEIVKYDNLGEPSDPFVGILWKIHILNEIPWSWGLVVGDAVNNLRAALDHAVFGVAVANGASFDAKTRKLVQYPIASSEEIFERAASPLRPFLSSAQLSAIASRQPYRNEPPSLMETLRDLSNRDKHRALMVVSQAPIDFTIKTQIPGFNQRSISGKPIVDGMVLASARFRRPTDGRSFDAKITLRHIEHIEVEGEAVSIPAAILLEALYQEVFSAVADLTEGLWNDEDRTIIRAEHESQPSRFAKFDPDLRSKLGLE